MCISLRCLDGPLGGCYCLHWNWVACQPINTAASSARRIKRTKKISHFTALGRGIVHRDRARRALPPEPVTAVDILAMSPASNSPDGEMVDGKRSPGNVRHSTNSKCSQNCDRFIPISEAHIGNENIRIGHLIVRRGDDFGPNRHFCVALTVLHVTGLWSGLHFSTHRSLPSIRGLTACPPLIDFLCDLSFRL